jgi:hypothetical protein
MNWTTKAAPIATKASRGIPFKTAVFPSSQTQNIMNTTKAIEKAALDASHAIRKFLISAPACFTGHYHDSGIWA